MRLEIETSILGTGPSGIQRERLAPQLLGDAERLHGSEALDALPPILVLRSTHPVPIAGHVLANPSRDHDSIVAPTSAPGKRS